MSDHRAELLEYLRGGNAELEASAVTGYLIIVELITSDGELGVARITSDPNGRPLPWHRAAGLAHVAGEIDDFDRVEA